VNSNNIRYRLTIRLVGTGPHVFKMTVKAAEYDPDPSNNTKIDSFIRTIAAPPKITGSYTLSRAPGQILADVKLTNSGGSTASGTVISTASLDVGTGPVAALAPAGPVDIPAGGSATVRVAFPGNVFASGSRALMTLNGAYAGGSFGMSFRVVLP
jgi:hypothetical protein